MSNQTFERVKVSSIWPIEDEYGNQYLSRDYSLQVNVDYVRELADSFGPDGEPEEAVTLVRDGDLFRIKAGNSRVMAMQLLGTEECWAVIDEDDTPQGLLETVVKTNVKKKYEPIEESGFVQQLALFGDDDYVGSVSGIGAERAAALRRGRKIAADKSGQMTLEHLEAIADFEGYPEWAQELSEAPEDKWRSIASNLRRRKDQAEAVSALEIACRNFKIKVVEEQPEGTRYAGRCENPENLERVYMEASVNNKSIVAVIARYWDSAAVELYGEALDADGEKAAAAERRKAHDLLETKCKAVDESVWEWVVEQFDNCYENELPGAFRVLFERCMKKAHEQYWVKSTIDRFKGEISHIEGDEGVFLFLLGYDHAQVKLASYLPDVLSSEDPKKHYCADRAREALKWVYLHEDDGWEPDKDMAKFLRDARKKLGDGKDKG